ncbi:hypothetical protein V490_01390 [Pseudogymnoascus sp. VKM F-3557]|nr:hypothetical protein V490_01390 [Pseudogymnoascus sp. VKM F-3557]
MKVNTMNNTPIGVLLANTLAVSSLVASVVASPILTPGTALTSKKSCIFGSCGLGNRCRKENSCVGINLFDQDWSHCQTCACPSQVFGRRTDPTCVMDYDCLNVQLGNRPDPCAQTMRRAAPSPEIADREASADPVLLRAAGVRGDGVIDPVDPNAKLPDFKKYLASTSQRSPIEPDDVDAAAIERLRDSLPPSHVIRKRSELMDEFARLIDDGPSGPVTPDAAMMERLRSITHPEKRGGCYTIENGVAVEKRGGCGKEDVNDLIDVDADVDADGDLDFRKRGGCYTTENGVAVEKRGGCGLKEDGIDLGTDLDVDVLRKRGACYAIENGAIVEKHGGCGLREGTIVNDIPDGDFHASKRGGCFTVENGSIVEKRGGCGLKDGDGDNDVDGDIYVDVDVNRKKRGGCYTVENGAIVEKRGGCRSEELEAEANVEKRSGCFIETNGLLFVDPDCGVPDHDFDGKQGGYYIVENEE